VRRVAAGGGRAVEMTEEKNPPKTKSGDFSLPWKAQKTKTRFPHSHRPGYDCQIGSESKPERSFLHHRPGSSPGSSFDWKRLSAVAGSAPALILDSLELTARVLNVKRTDTFFPIRPKPDLHTTSLVILVRRPPPPGSSALLVPHKLYVLPVLVEGQGPYLFQGRQPYINASIIGHLGIVRRTRS